MKSNSSIVFVALAAALGFSSGSIQAAALASDSATNAAYSGGWNTGANGGSGFGAWSLVQTPGSGFAGNFIAGSTQIGPDIGTAFQMYANPSGADNRANRSLTGGALSAGQTLSFDLSVNFRNPGTRGFSLFSGGTSGTDLLDFNVTNDKYILSVGASSQDLFGDAYSATAPMHFSFTQGSGGSVEVSVVRPGFTTFDQVLALGSSIDSFQFFINGTGNQDQANLGFNNLAVVPEPSSIALLGMGAISALAFLRRRK